MTISFEQMQALLQQQQQQFEQSQMRLLESLTKMSLQPTAVNPETTAVESVVSSIREFQFDPNTGLTFESWFKKYEDIFNIELAKLEDAQKVRLLLRKLGSTEHDRYINFILPKHPRDCTFKDTVETLSHIFGEPTSLFNTRYQCLKLVKDPNSDWVTYAGNVNQYCERFKLRTMTEDQFKCLIFACGLQSGEDADIRTRIISRLEQHPDLTLQSITTECQRLVNLKHDTAMIERQSHSSVCTVSPHQDKPMLPGSNSTKKPRTACWHCGELHYSRFCKFKRHTCSTCHKRGHKDGLCKRGSNFRETTDNKGHNHPERARAVTTCSAVNTRSKRKFVQIKVNDRKVRLQLDTASDITLISRRTWEQIGRPAVVETSQTAHGATGDWLKIAGQIECTVQFNSASFQGVCYLTEHHDLNLLGLDWMEPLQLLDQPLNAICNRTSAAQAIKIDGQKNPVKADLRSWYQASKPWERVHIDFAGPIEGITYLVIVDSYSKWPEIHPMNQTTASATVAKLVDLCSIFGIPEVIVTDNGTQFTGELFQSWCAKNSIQHIKSPPYHPQSNGQAERFVDTFKRALLKSKGEGTPRETIPIFLTAFRTTPNRNTPEGRSPAECMLGRKPRTTLDVIRPQQHRVGSRDDRMERQFNRHHGTRDRCFSPGAAVYARNYRGNQRWIPAQVVRKRGEVTYDVKVGSMVWSRHVNQLRRAEATVDSSQDKNLQLDILLDTFNVDRRVPITEATSELARISMLPRRRSNRRRTRVRPMQIDPRQRSYT